MNEALEREVVVLNAVLALSPEERAGYLDQACAGDAALRRQVETLLESHEQAGDFLAGDSPDLDISRAQVASVSTARPLAARIGRYRLLRQIGEGGCGVVYLAEQEEPVRRSVALKVIKPGMDTRQVIARFEAERQALALMDHPNIAKIFDAGTTEDPHPVSGHPLRSDGKGAVAADVLQSQIGNRKSKISQGRPYFVMELVNGVKITAFCDEHMLATRERLQLFVQVCQAVQHAHQKGVIHRDIKPSNILVTLQDGVPVPKVIDFGIAKATAGRLTDQPLFTVFEQFIGTPAYMSPEQATMTALDIDTRSDIYSLGVLLYELLTGGTPFDAGELLATGLDEMRRIIRERDPAKPSTRLSRLPRIELATTAQRRQTDAPRLIHLLRGDLDWIVMRALEKDRTRRYETANGLAMDVQRHLNNEPVNARPPNNWYRLQKMVKRNQLTFAASTAVAVTILLALVFLAVSNVRTIHERNKKDIALQEKAAALDAAHASEQRAKEELFASLRSQAQAHRFSRQMGQRLQSLAALAEAAHIRVDAGLRDDAIAAMALPDVRRGPSWQIWRTNSVALASDPIGQRYAVLDRQGVITVRTIEDNREIHRFESSLADPEVFTSLTFSPDGRYLAKVGDGQQPRLWSLDTGRAILHDAPVGSSAPTFSALRGAIALAAWKDVLCFDLATGHELNRWATAGHVHSLQFHPTQPWIAVAYKSGPWVSVYDSTNGREIAQLEVGIGSRMVVSWHPDGRYLVVCSTARGIQVWDANGQRRMAELNAPAHEVDFLTFHPSGDWLASWSWDGMLQLWDPATGRQAMQIPLVAHLEFSRDGRWLGFLRPEEDQAQLLEFVTPQEYFTLQDHSRPGRLQHHACAVSPDDRLLAVAMDHGVRLWDLAGHREIALLPSGVTEDVVFESEGKALWTCAEKSGLQRWPIRTSSTNALEWLLGPPQRIELPFAPVRIAADGAGLRLAVVSEIAGQAILLDLPRPTLPATLLQHPQASYVALSPDGKRLATSAWHSDRVHLWDTGTGRLIREWMVGQQTRVKFTPDSLELIVARSGEFQFLRVDTLEPTRRLKREIGLYAGDIAFAPNGQLMALEMAPAVIHLMEVLTGRTVARLTDPFGDRSNALCFSRDGTRLIAVSTYSGAVHIWDLRAIRTQLKTMDLDWDWPEFASDSRAVNRQAFDHSRWRLQVVGANSN